MAVAGRADVAVENDAVEDGGVRDEGGIVAVAAGGEQDGIGVDGNLLALFAGGFDAHDAAVLHDQMLSPGVEHDRNASFQNLGVQGIDRGAGQALAAVVRNRFALDRAAGDAHAQALEPFDGRSGPAGLIHGETGIVVELADAAEVKEQLLDVRLGHLGIVGDDIARHTAAGHGSRAADGRHLFDDHDVLHAVLIGRHRRGKTRSAAADDQHVDVHDLVLGSGSSGSLGVDHVVGGAALAHRLSGGGQHGLRGDGAARNGVELHGLLLNDCRREHFQRVGADTGGFARAFGGHSDDSGIGNLNGDGNVAAEALGSSGVGACSHGAGRGHAGGHHHDDEKQGNKLLHRMFLLFSSGH